MILTTYGECPNCGAMCQPDGMWTFDWVEEGAECEKCGTWFEYHYNPQGAPDVYEQKWIPVLIDIPER